MRHDTPTTLERQTPAARGPRRLVALAALATCLAGGILAFTPGRNAASAHVSHATRLIADGCTSSSGPCAPTRG